MKALIFDFDWVIHDSFEFHRNKIKDFSGIWLDVQFFKDMHNGNFFDDIPKEVKNINWAEYRDYIYDDYTKLKTSENIKSTIIQLTKKFILLIVSSGWRKNIEDYLKNNWIFESFSEILGMEHDNSKVVKLEYILKNYWLKSEECLFITDTLWDILEANKVKIKTLAVDFWYHSKDVLAKWNPHKIISNFAEIWDYL